MDIELPYSPKLKQAMEEIKSIMRKYDIAGFVVLHDGQKHAEYLNHLSPSWSCVKIIPPQVKLQARLKEDFNGDKKRQIEVLKSTATMLHGISAVSVREMTNMVALSKMMDNHLGAEYDEGTHTGHQEFGN